jgi:hypothetical protein
MMARRKSRIALLVLLLSALLIATASAAIYYQITASMTFEVGWSPVVFTSGEDTSTCGGSLTNNASATFSSVPLTIESNITITQLVNVTNSDGASGHDVNVTVSSETFGTELSILLLYIVSPTGSETLVVNMGDSGTIVTQGVEVTIPASEEWAIKLVGCYDSGTSESQSNTMTLNLEVN